LGSLTKWNPKLKDGNPAYSHLMKKYHKFVRRGQGIARIIPEQIALFEFSTLKNL